jgi:transcription elongation factor Elf1
MRTKSENINFPFWQVVHNAEQLIDKGATVRQKFTCANCGSRLTIDVANQFFRTATCDHCGRVTNIEARGCNLMVEMN